MTATDRADVHADGLHAAPATALIAFKPDGRFEETIRTEATIATRS
ncbi:hypothetical protein [Streptomyces sp. NPDC060002]